MLEHLVLQQLTDPDLGVCGGNGELQFHGVESEVRFLMRAEFTCLRCTWRI
ncbi:hypothetical protein D3C86_2204170 [compost metagenome]